MKRIYILLLALWFIPPGCRDTRDVKFYFLKIKPIGNNDFPRVLFYVSTTKMDSICKIDSSEDGGFIHQIVTDEKTLLKVISLSEGNYPNRNNPTKKFSEYGCLETSLYEKKMKRTSFNLDRSEGQKYLKALLNILAENVTNSKSIRDLKENALDPINY